VLSRRGGEFEIRCNGWELMSSRAHCSEEALARLACAALPPAPRVLIGGLGMGFTLRTALDVLPASARVVVAEIAAGIIVWNRGPLAALAGRPLEDARVTVQHGDVADLLSSGPFDAIMLDIDNGPAIGIYRGESRLYGTEGLQRLKRALAPDGVLAIWSAERSPAFEQTLSTCGFDRRGTKVPARDETGPHHTIYLASRLDSCLRRNDQKAVPPYPISRSSASISASLKPKWCAISCTSTLRTSR
jgi:spermidine synthase